MQGKNRGEQLIGNQLPRLATGSRAGTLARAIAGVRLRLDPPGGAARRAPYPRLSDPIQLFGQEASG